MTGEGWKPDTPVWIEAASGWLVHDPGAMNWGPARACPVSVAVAPVDDANPRRHRSVEVTVHDVTVAGVLLNPGAARWLGNRLIEAAVLAETRPAAVAAATAAAATAEEQDAQCLLHEDCATPQVCNAVTEAEFVTRGYSDFDHRSNP